MADVAEQLNAFLVGGAVRDALLGLPVKDRDWVVVGADHERMLALGFKAVGRDFPVYLHPRTKEEYALARTETKTAPGYTGFVFDAGPQVTLEQDLARRDLTINAMAQSPDGELIDPFGGRHDLEQGVLRHVSDAFVEDPVRVLRVARFRARFGFDIAPETLALMQRISAAGEVDALVAERVWQELVGALGEARPSLFIASLRDAQSLARIFPEIDALFGVPQRKDYHPEVDTGRHTLLALDAAATLTPDLIVRFAVLVHDLGKALTPRELWPSHRGHEERGLDVVRTFCERLRAPRNYREMALTVCRYHLHMHRLAELKPGTVLNLLEAVDAFHRPHRVEQFVLACEADSRGRTGLENRPYPQSAWLQECHRAAAGVDLSPALTSGAKGPRIAEEIRRLRIQAIADASTHFAKR